jgi:hypothetical protein
MPGFLSASRWRDFKHLGRVLRENPINTLLFMRAIGANQTRDRLALKLPDHFRSILRPATDKTIFYDSGMLADSLGWKIAVVMIQCLHANFINRRGVEYKKAQEFCGKLGHIITRKA